MKPITTRFLQADIVEPLELISCGHFMSDGDWAHDRRTMDTFELLIGTKGTAYLQQDEERFELAPGQALLFLPGHTHCGYKKSERAVSFYWLHFRCRGGYALLSPSEQAQLVRPFAHNPRYGGLAGSVLVPIFGAPRNHERAIILFRQLLHSYSAHYYSPRVNEYLLTLIFTELTQQAVDDSLEKSREAVDSRFNRVLQWLRTHADTRMGVEELAKRFGYNRVYLTRCFKRHTGVGVLEYLHGLKIMRAKELLCDATNATMSIKEIAYRLGFADDKYFMKLFKKHENMTPSQYRASFYQTYINGK